MFIIERILEKCNIVESDRTKLPQGVLCRAVYPICNIGELNRNKRVYSKEVWNKVLSDDELNEKLRSRCLFGHAEHPRETSQSSTEKISHVVNKMFYDPSDENKVKTEIDVLDTPYGRIVDTLLRAGCGVGVSTRAEGELQEFDQDGQKCFNVVTDSYKFKTIDFTADPSTYGAYPESVERDVVGQIKKGFEEKKIDQQYASMMLEGMQIPEAKALLESIDKHSDNVLAVDTKVMYGDKSAVIARVYPRLKRYLLEFENDTAERVDYDKVKLIEKECCHGHHVCTKSVGCACQKNEEKIKETIADTNLDPKYLYSIAHKGENVKGIWWYNIETGEIRISKDQPHSSETFKDIAYKSNWIRGRVFEYGGKNFLIVYFKDILGNKLIDIIDKLELDLDLTLDHVIDDKGEDISHLLESLSEDVRKRFSITKCRVIEQVYTGGLGVPAGMCEDDIAEKIVKVGDKWQVQSSKGKNMGTYSTEEEAKKRLKQVEYFKHKDESKVNEDFQHLGFDSVLKGMQNAFDELLDPEHKKKLDESKTHRELFENLHQVIVSNRKNVAIAIAERDKLNELADLKIKNIEESCKKILEGFTINHKKEIDLIKNTHQSTIKEMQDKYISDMLALNDQVIKTEGKFKIDLAKMTNEGVASKLIESNKQFGEKLLKEIKIVYEKKLDDAKKLYESKIKLLEESHKRDIFIKTIVDRKVTESGLSLPEDAVALLHHCRSEQEVDKYLSDFRYGLKESFLHSRKQDITIETGDSDVNPLVAETNRLVRGMK